MFLDLATFLFQGEQMEAGVSKVLKDSLIHHTMEKIVPLLFAMGLVSWGITNPSI